MRVRRLLRWLAYGVGLLVILALTGLVVFQTAWFRDRLRREAVTRSAALLNGQLSIGKLSGSLWRGVTLEHVAFAQEGRTIFEAERIDVRYDPYVLMKRKIVFDEVIVRGLVVRAVQAADGWNVSHMLKPSDRQKPPKAFTIRHLGVIGGDVTVTARDAAPRRVSGVTFDGSLSRLDRGLEMTFDRLSARDERTGLLLRELAGTAKDSFREIDLTFAADLAPASLAGRVRSRAGTAARELDADVDLTHVDVSTLLENPRWATDVTGHAKVHAVLPATPGGMSVQFDFTGPHAAGFGYEAREVRATGEVTAAGVTFDARGLAYGARAAMVGTWRRGAAPGVPSRLDGTGTFSNVDLRRVPGNLPLPRLATQLAGRYAVHTRGGVWSADVTLGESTAAGARIAAGTIGHIDMRNGVPRYSGQGHLTGLDLNQLAGPLDLPALAATRYRSRLTGYFYVAGSGRTARDRLVLGGATLDESTLGAARVPFMSASMTLTGRRLAIDAHGDFSGLDAQTLGVPTSVALDLHGRVDGTIVIPNLDLAIGPETIDVGARVTLANSTVEGVEIRQASVDGDLKAGFAQIRELTADGPAAHLRGSGTLALGQEGESAMTISADVADLGVIGARANRPLAGGVHIEANVTGPPDLLTAAGSLSGHQVAYGTTASALTLNSTFTATVPDRAWSRGTIEAKSAATFVTLGDFELLRVAATSTYTDRRLQLEAKLEEQARTLDVTGVLALEPEAQAIELTRLALATAGTEWRLPEGQPARVRYGSDRVTVQGLVLTNQAQRVEADGSLAISADAATADSGLRMTLSNVQVADLNRLLLGTRRLEGVVNGVANLKGAFKAPVVQGELTVTKGSVEGVTFDSLSATVQSAGSRLAIDATLDQTPTNRLTAVGTMPFTFGGAGDAGELDLRVESTPVALGLVQAFTGEINEVVGTATLDLNVTGPMARPKIDGTVSVAGGGFRVGATGVTYRNLDARLGLEASRLRIDEFRIADTDGHMLTAEGGVDIVSGATGRAVDVRIRGNGFHVLDNPLGDIALDVDLRASGTLTAPRLEGSLSLEQGRLQVDQVLERTTKNPYRTTPQEGLDATAATPVTPAAEAPPPPASPRNIFDQAELDIRVDFPGNFVLRGRDMRLASRSVALGDMNVIAGGSFEIKKAAGGAVAAQGSVEILRGFYSFQGKRFDVQRGSEVRLRANEPTNPTLMLTGEREVSGVTAEVQIRGTARNPRIELSSRPPLDESDILSLIIFDRPVNDLGSAERVSLAERAGTLAAGAIASPLAASVARALNLDVFEIRTGGFNGEGTAVSLGSQIGTRLFVGLKQEFGHDEVSTVSFEYRVTNLLRLITSVAYGTLQANAARRNEAGGGIDLIYVIRY